MDYNKLIENVLSESQMSELPEELTPAYIHLWKGDINSEKDWDDFAGGQLVNHLTYVESLKAGIDVHSLQYGSNVNSYYGLLNHNTTIELYTSEFKDLTGKYVTVGDNERPYLAISHALSDFSLADDTEANTFMTKIVLVDVTKYLSDQLDEGTPAPTINIVIGKVGTTVKVPKYKNHRDDEIYDPAKKDFKVIDRVIPIPKTIEWFLPEPAGIIGIDTLTNTDGTVLTDKLVKPTNATLKPTTFPINPFYCIAPTQFNIPSIDNYGFTHPTDSANGIKTLLATSSLATAANTGVGGFASAGILGTVATTISNGIIGLGQKHFGDKGTLANSLAIIPKFVRSDSDGLKMFIQGEGAANGSLINSSGYLNLQGLLDQDDYIEINQGNGEFGKYGKPMSPSLNNEFNDTHHYRGLGLHSLKMNKPSIPAIASPFAEGKYANLKINDTKINDFLAWGVPRLESKSGEIIPPMILSETWQIYIRNMFFRPDAYSFWNWPILFPAEIGFYNVEQRTSIAYDYQSAVVDIAKDFGKINDGSTNANLKDSYWAKTITLDQITNNDLYDPNKTISSGRLEFKTGQLKNLYQTQLAAFTSSVLEINLLDENDEIIRTHKFNTQGRNIGTSASFGTVVQY